MLPDITSSLALFVDVSQYLSEIVSILSAKIPYSKIDRLPADCSTMQALNIGKTSLKNKNISYRKFLMIFAH